MTGNERAMKWYEALEYSDRKSVDKKIARLIEHVTSKGRTQFSQAMGIELIYKTLMVL
jgi:hypothetical protein